MLVALCLAKLSIHLLAAGRYGYTGDELYFLACADNLDWGYVDHPPFSVWLLWGVRELLGDSLYAVRTVPVLVGVATIGVVVEMARRLGAGPFGQAVAGASVLLSPLYLGLHNAYSMNAIDILLWAIAQYACIRIGLGGGRRWWMGLAAVMGMGLLNKLSMLWLGFGLAVGIATSERRWLVTPAPWLTAGAALACLSPYVLWQVPHGWPTLEWTLVARAEALHPSDPLGLLAGQVLLMHPALLPVWVLGFAWLLFAADARPFRFVGILVATVFVLLLASGSSRGHYFGPAYPVLFAAGAVAIERGLPRVLRWPVVATAAAAAIAALPLALPVLPLERALDHAELLGLSPPREERREYGRVPWNFAFMLGWEEVVESVARRYHALDPADRERAALLAGTYLQAAAIDRFGPEHGLPRPISGHNSYGIWGPRGHSGDVVLALGGDRAYLGRYFAEVQPLGSIDCTFCMPSERGTIFLCRRPRRPLAEMWPELRHYRFYGALETGGETKIGEDHARPSRGARQSSS